MTIPATHPTHHVRRARLLSGALLVAASALGGQAWAATTQDLTVNVTMTIDAAILVYWCDENGTDGTKTALAQSWTMGTGIALNTEYHTTATDIGMGNTGVNSNTLAVPHGTVPALRYIKNLSNCSVDIAVVGANTSSGNWTVGGTAASNVFELGANKDLGQYTPLSITPSAGWIDALAYDAVSPQIGLRLKTPTAITVGGGRSQSIVVKFTASAD